MLQEVGTKSERSLLSAEYVSFWFGLVWFGILRQHFETGWPGTHYVNQPGFELTEILSLPS